MTLTLKVAKQTCVRPVSTRPLPNEIQLDNCGINWPPCPRLEHAGISENTCNVMCRYEPYFEYSVNLVYFRLARKQRLHGQQLSKYTANRPEVNRCGILLK